MVQLPDGYCWTNITLEHATRMAEIINHASETYSGGVSFTPAEIALEIQDSDAAWGIENQAGELVAFEQLWVNTNHAIFELDGSVSPDHLGLGLGTALVHRAEEEIQARWHAQPDTTQSPTIKVQFNGRDPHAIQLFTDFGLTREKQDLVMEIQLTEAPSATPWPAEFSMREFVPGQDDRAVFAVINAAFQSIRGFSERSVSFENWKSFSIERAGFDPSLWFLATYQSEIAGICLCPHDKDVGWIRQLAVHPDYRGNGLGQALMNHAFGEWYARGYSTIQLAVQGDNTAAIALYEKVGMRGISLYETFAKPLE